MGNKQDRPHRSQSVGGTIAPQTSLEMAETIQQWKLFHDLENREEADVLQVSRFLQALKDHMPELEKPKNNKPTLQKIVSSEEYIGTIDISDMYKGVRLDQPMTPKNVVDLIDNFKKSIKLHRSYVVQIVVEATKLLQDLPNIQHVSIAPAKHITVVGDLHGQLDDLLLILRENGLPSPENPYVFNGDFVDRGQYSIEVLLLLLSFFIVYPGHVFLNRGNHEDRSVNERFGFRKECIAKYDEEIYDLCSLCFEQLPIATVIDNRILVLHGGLPRWHHVMTEWNAIPRCEFAGSKHTNKSFKTSTALSAQDKAMQSISDILWSDPYTEPQWKESFRGAGIQYGPELAKEFLQVNNLELIVRSHECVPMGYEWPYGDRGMVLTLFSASNYSRSQNAGAIMRIPADATQTPTFLPYRATLAEHDFVATNLDGLYSVILSNRAALKSAFEAIDTGATGFVSLNQWQTIMETTLNMSLDWAVLQPLVTTAENNQVPYMNFLDRYQSSTNENAPPGKRQVFNALYRHRHRLEALFRTLDKDGNGVITLDELQEGLRVLNQHLPQDILPFEHSEQLMRALDFSHDNQININEFMESFRLHANLTVQAKWRRARNKLKAMYKLGVLKSVKAEPTSAP